VGVGENNKLEQADLAQLPHLLVAGSTFTGKSVHLNQILCQFISRNTPAEVQMMLIDLKDGTEFQLFENLPHLVRPIVTRAEDVPDALHWFQDEMMSRRAKFRSAGVKTIDGWNHVRRDQKMPYIVLAFDELGSVMKHPDAALVKKVEPILYEIMATSRSSGGHGILSTQRPSSDVIPSWIKANAAGRLCFAVPSNTDSIVVIDNGMASKIDRDVPGRAIWSRGPKFVEIQSAFISDHQIKEIVKEASSYVTSEYGLANQVTLDDILIEAVDNFGGALHVERLFKSLRGRISRDGIKELVGTLNGGPIYVHGDEYRFVKGAPGKHGGKRLVPVADATQPRLNPAFKFAKYGAERSFLKSDIRSRSVKQPEPAGNPAD
jgi:S-DNA-T family DNA segregation ATPase FtsK/SpoIIIE